MRLLHRAAHLARRFFGSLSPAEPPAPDAHWACAHLLAAEEVLWKQMSAADRRHSVAVARRFAALAPHANRAEMAGALLHDVGKICAGLGTAGRVVATVVGPRTRRFRLYHEHEALGEQLARGAGSEPATLDLIAGRGRLGELLLEADTV